MPETDTRRIHHELTETYENIRHWNDTVLRLDEEAAEARRLAHQLDTELATIRNALQPVRAQHTTSVWQGRAGEQSRRRLDRHEDEHRIAIRRIDTLIDDLLARAAVASTSANASRDARDAVQLHALSLERAQRGALEDVGHP